MKVDIRGTASITELLSFDPYEFNGMTLFEIQDSVRYELECLKGGMWEWDEGDIAEASLAIAGVATRPGPPSGA